jgi:hypothetical protein
MAATHPATEHQLVLGLATEVAMSENSRKATLCHISAGNLLKLSNITATGIECWTCISIVKASVTFIFS